MILILDHDGESKMMVVIATGCDEAVIAVIAVIISSSSCSSSITAVLPSLVGVCLC